MDGAGRMLQVIEDAVFAAKQYDAIVSLGAWCAPAATIRRYFGTNVPYPFDWWQCPYFPTMKLLEERFANVLKLENLQVLPAMHGRESTVRCNYYQFNHHHDFKRNEDGEIIADIASQLASVRRRTSYIIDLFLRDLVGKDVLLVRAGLNGHLWEKERGLPMEKPTRQEQLQRAANLHAAVRQCIRARSVDMVVVSNLRPNTILPLEGGQVIFEQLGDITGKTGFFHENYAALFERLQVSLRA
jgi:hypothetical protein